MVIFRFGVRVDELINVTSNVNGWLPVQDGGAWRSDTDSYITNLIGIYSSRLCVAKQCFNFLVKVLAFCKDVFLWLT